MESLMFVKSKSSEDNTVCSFHPSRSLFARIRRHWRRERIQRSIAQYKAERPNGLELFSDDRTSVGSEVVDQCPEADVLNLHWIANFVDLGTFFDRVDVPVVWTLHDMNAFTGGCHYNVGCKRYRSACGACPQLGSEDDNDLSRAVWQRKSDAYQSAIENDRLHIVAPSRWLAEEARQSSLLAEAAIHVIPYGLNITTFRPRETAGLRQSLEIPDYHRILLFVAQSTTNRRKGFDLLQDALRELSVDDVTLVSIGSHEPNLDADLPHVHLGSIQSDLLLSLFYSLADVFVIPSRQDNLPNTVLESMACATPVVGFGTGGIPDMVRLGETGWLAEVGNVPSLRETIERALENPDARERLGRQCREVVLEEYTLERQAEAYKALYADLLSRSHS
jgi:glycosyltransferase involved in cell wall biosynthesis